MRYHYEGNATEAIIGRLGMVLCNDVHNGYSIALQGSHMAVTVLSACMSMRLPQYVLFGTWVCKEWTVVFVEKWENIMGCHIHTCIWILTYLPTYITRLWFGRRLCVQQKSVWPLDTMAF